MAPRRPPYLLRLKVNNFRSLRDVDVRLAPLNVLVGPNGAGKSNLLDVIAFLGDAIRDDLRPALERRPGFERVLFWGQRTTTRSPSRPASSSGWAAGAGCRHLTPSSAVWTNRAIHGDRLPAGQRTSSKAALNALTLIYANALRADGIKVNAASPGLVPTDQNAAATFPRGDRTTADGAIVPVLLATISADGPTGVFRGSHSLDDVIPW